MGDFDWVCDGWCAECTWVRLCVTLVRVCAKADFVWLFLIRVRALGETDLNPVSGLGKISQLLFAWIQPGNVVANIIAGGVAEAGAQQCVIFLFAVILCTDQFATELVISCKI